MSDERIVQLKACKVLQSGTWRHRVTFSLAQTRRHNVTDLALASDTIQLPQPLQVSQSCSYLGSLKIDNDWCCLRYRSPVNTIRRTLLWIYLLCLLNLPNFYASRLLMNSAGNSPWILDNEPDCDLDFCRRVLMTFLREWKILRIFATVLFGSILAMLQISRVESDLIIGFPIYLSLICGVMAAVSSTVLDLYFQSGKSSLNILAWVNSLRTISSPQRFNDGSVVLAIPAVSTAWCTVLFVLSIVTFAFRAYTNQNAVRAAENNLPIGASSAFRVVFSVFAGINLMFLVMLFATLRRISKGYSLTERNSRSENASCVR